MIQLRKTVQTNSYWVTWQKTPNFRVDIKNRWLFAEKCDSKLNLSKKEFRKSNKRQKPVEYTRTIMLNITLLISSTL